MYLRFPSIQPGHSLRHQTQLPSTAVIECRKNHELRKSLNRPSAILQRTIVAVAVTPCGMTSSSTCWRANRVSRQYPGAIIGSFWDGHHTASWLRCRSHMIFLAISERTPVTLTGTGASVPTLTENSPWSKGLDEIVGPEPEFGRRQPRASRHAAGSRSEHGCIRQEGLMTLKLTAERYAKRREEMMQRLTQGVREMFAESAAKQSMAGRMYPNLIKPTSYYTGILRIGNYGEHGETIFLARRTRVPRARDSGGLSAHLAHNPVRHCGKRVLHAQLEAIPRNAAQKQVVWSHARKLGARQKHFAAFEDSGSRDDRREPHHFIRIFHHSVFCDDFRYHRVRRCIAIHPHEAEPAKIAACG